MYFDFEKEKLLEIAKNFHIISGAQISILNANLDGIVCYPECCHGFCALMKNNSKYNDRCLENDTYAKSKCLQDNKPYIYFCHAGLTEVIAPIIYNDIPIAYVMLGQLASRPDNKWLKYKTDDLAKDFPYYDIDTINHLIGDVKNLNLIQIKSLFELIPLCTNYILTNQLFKIRKSEIAKKTEEFINDNINSDISVLDICSQLHVCKTTLFNVSREYFGCGITQYIKNKRIAIAKDMLINTDITIGSIAISAGYNDSNYFIRVFKSSTGLTPNQFRKAKVHVR